ncbi:uncharacterized protein BT62DRAFT_1076154 [Guyanagaster necrorhizus]|uniref:Uncharacterized protein n=1 Tax=Guyanagaster necrorhizus TaxID=856835 RepID=A0A9P8ASN9_9AGAR|nr:uncharacterized protein BT62DRAFT_1076154 [Guyanagaster necrorhizus MCA 3950]KAG7446613.1 hypothetical protein BT62DRAFT_1076154 [Guyanagaster necrorhizus MCA 3950]
MPLDVWFEVNRGYSQSLDETRKNLLVIIIRDYTTASSRYPCTKVLPGLADFYTFQSIKEILERPADVMVDADTFSSLFSELPDLCDEWRLSLDDQLLARFSDLEHCLSMSTNALNIMDVTWDRRTTLQEILDTYTLGAATYYTFTPDSIS